MPSFPNVFQKIMSLFNKHCIQETSSKEMGDWMGNYVQYWYTLYLLTLELMMLIDFYSL